MTAWKNKIVGNKIWANTKKYFSGIVESQEKYQKMTGRSTNRMNFESAKVAADVGNEMRGISEKLTLANANQDQDAMYKLQQTNDKMAMLAEQLEDQLKAKDEQIAALTAQVSGLNNSIQTLTTTIACVPVGKAGGNEGGGRGGGDRGDSVRGRGKPEQKTGGRNIGGYCWSCGFDSLAMNHGRAEGSCFKPKTGHKVEATAANTMGGSQQQATKAQYVEWQRHQYTKRN